MTQGAERAENKIEVHNLFASDAYTFSSEKHILFKAGRLYNRDFYILLFIMIGIFMILWGADGESLNRYYGRFIFCLILGSVALPGAWKRLKNISKYAFEVGPEGLLLHSHSSKAIPWSDIVEMGKVAELEPPFGSKLRQTGQGS